MPAKPELAAGGKSLPIMVLAHNEERHITACLDSIFTADPHLTFAVYVMANGCTDCTEDIVRTYRLNRPEVELVSIALGDKCNAWNVFIHEVIPTHCQGRDIYFFMDGDARAVRGSFSAMLHALRSHPYANAASAVPASGRNIARDRAEILREQGLVANLYSLRGSFVERLRAQSVRIPLKLEGDDGLIGAFVKWDLNPGKNWFDDARIVACPDAAFEFEPLSPMNLAHWKIYWKRAVRYGRRHYEFRLLGPVLENGGLAAMPVDITDLYPQYRSLTLRWQGLYTLSNLIALRQMRHIGNRKFNNS
jgi:glycosyltransferase involved in cell wall biosynthesis